MNKDKFSRIIKMSDPTIPFMTKPNDDKWKEFEKTVIPFMNNCHWGTLKLFYSELEFINIVSKYIDINECLVLYVGAQPGFRLKHLFVKHFFPKMKMLLYDPLDFDIEEDEQIIIKTGIHGWFSDETIDEVLKIANGRKIIYISDIRLNDDDSYQKESNIHDDMQKQQRWGVMMGAEFMLLKFRMFFYSKTGGPKEVDFIDNTLPEMYKDKIIFNKNEKKHKSNYLWMLYLSGTLFTQIYSPQRSTESRLFVKKIKYHKDKDNYSKEEQEKYKMKYYNNLKYEGIFNYFNLVKRNQNWEYKKSKKLVKYIPGFTVSYSSASEYYIMRKYFLSQKIKPSFNKILSNILYVHTFLGNRYTNNLIICGCIQNYKHKLIKTILYKDKDTSEYSKYNEDSNKDSNKDGDKDAYYSLFNLLYEKDIFDEKIQKIIDERLIEINEQLQNLIKTKNIDEKQKKDYLNSIKRKNLFYYIDNRNKIILKMKKNY
jgi:hypothetical protein